MTVTNRSRERGQVTNLTRMGSSVSIGIDAGVVAPHQVAVRGAGIAEASRSRRRWRA